MVFHIEALQAKLYACNQWYRFTVPVTVLDGENLNLRRCPSHRVFNAPKRGAGECQSL
jgi:hypothetical protein